MLLEKILDGSFALCTEEEICRALRLRGQEAIAVREMLHSLVREGELLCDSGRRYGTAMQFGAKRGTVNGNKRGFAFFVPDDNSGDLFLSRHAVKNAMHGDNVLAFPTGNGDEGEVLAVLSRGYSRIVGTYRRERQGGYLRADEKRFSEEVWIPAGKNMGCADNMKAVAHISSYDGRTPVGEIVEIIGKGGDLFAEEEAVIRSHELDEAFPEEVERAAERVLHYSIDPTPDRLDLTDELIVTVDGEDTRDIDDAISVKRNGKNFELGVHIADVSHYVPRGSALDREAFKRGTSVYFPDRVLPMLPKALSNGICSLNEGELRYTLSCLMTVDGKGNVIKKRVVPSYIRSRHRMTYTEMKALADRDRKAEQKFPDLLAFVSDAVELTEILKEARERRGSVSLDIRETKILYENGEIKIPSCGRNIAHEMIEQFMVLANESVASLMAEKGVPFVYRVHECPTEEKAQGFLTFLQEIGINTSFDPARVTPATYRDLLHSLEGSPLYPVVNRIMLRSMMKAVYSPVNVGHFGLASPCYCHFTSPIRRYPDLCVHRIVKATLTSSAEVESFSSFVEEASKRSSACERNAADAEREVDALYIAAYMHERMGETFEGVISGVTAFGLYVELENGAEGFVPIETLPYGEYEFYEEQFLLRGPSVSYRIGESVKVTVDSVDLGSKKVRFSLLGKVN